MRLFNFGDGQLYTIDEYLMGSMFADVSVEMLKDRTAERESHITRFVAGALFRLKICARLHLRGASHVHTVKLLLETLKKGRSEISSCTTMFTVYLGYGCQTLMAKSLLQ